VQAPAVPQQGWTGPHPLKALTCPSRTESDGPSSGLGSRFRGCVAARARPRNSVPGAAASRLRLQTQRTAGHSQAGTVTVTAGACRSASEPQGQLQQVRIKTLTQALAQFKFNSVMQAGAANMLNMHEKLCCCPTTWMVSGVLPHIDPEIAKYPKNGGNSISFRNVELMAQCSVPWHSALVHLMA
jgi:hypothetical protein